VKLTYLEYRVYSPPSSTPIDTESHAPVSSVRGVYGKKDHLDYWRCQVPGCTFGVRNTMPFDLHLFCKHIDGGLRWYCRHSLCQSRSWAAHSTRSVRQHEETYHSKNTDESYKFCYLRHPESLDEHWPQERKLRMSYDAMPWLNHNTGEPMHPNVIKSIASDALCQSILRQFLCTIQLYSKAYTSVRNIVIHQLTTHFNFVMACPIGC
jgi:hypothetical protein